MKALSEWNHRHPDSGYFDHVHGTNDAVRFGTGGLEFFFRRLQGRDRASVHFYLEIEGAWLQSGAYRYGDDIPSQRFKELLWKALERYWANSAINARQGVRTRTLPRVVFGEYDHTDPKPRASGDQTIRLEFSKYRRFHAVGRGHYAETERLCLSDGKNEFTVVKDLKRAAKGEDPYELYFLVDQGARRGLFNLVLDAVIRTYLREHREDGYVGSVVRRIGNSQLILRDVLEDGGSDARDGGFQIMFDFSEVDVDRSKPGKQLRISQVVCGRFETVTDSLDVDSWDNMIADARKYLGDGRTHETAGDGSGVIGIKFDEPLQGDVAGTEANVPTAESVDQKIDTLVEILKKREKPTSLEGFLFMALLAHLESYEGQLRPSDPTGEAVIRLQLGVVQELLIELVEGGKQLTLVATFGPGSIEFRVETLRYLDQMLCLGGLWSFEGELRAAIHEYYSMGSRKFRRIWERNFLTMEVGGLVETTTLFTPELALILTMTPWRSDLPTKPAGHTLRVLVPTDGAYVTSLEGSSESLGGAAYTDGSVTLREADIVAMADATTRIFNLRRTGSRGELGYVSGVLQAAISRELPRVYRNHDLIAALEALREQPGTISVDAVREVFLREVPRILRSVK